MRLLALFVLLFSLFARGEPTNVVVYSTDTGLGNLPCWGWWYNDSICPSGMARQTSGVCSSTNASGDITLPLTMLAGTYQAYVKVVCLNSSVGATNMVVGLTAPGGTTIEKAPDDRNADAYWTILGPLTFPTATNKVTFNWRTTDGINNIYPTKSMVALYLTTETNIIVTPDDYVQRWIVPTTTDASAPIAGNLLPNSSFEHGLDGWSLFPNTKVFYSPQDIVTNDAVYGVRSICIPNLPFTTSLASSALELSSMPMLVRPNKAHTLSWWTKVQGPLAKIQARIKPAVVTNATLGLPAQPVYQTSIISVTSTNWVRYSLDNQVLADYPSPAQYYVEFTFDPSGVAADTKVFMDGIQFEEGPTPTAFSPAYAHEVGVEQTQPGGTYYLEDNNSLLNLVVSGKEGSTESLTLVYQISGRGFTNLVTYTNGPTQWDPGRTVIPVDCNSLPLGPFRIASWLSNGAETEAYFSRIHRPQSLPRGQGVFGNHLEQWWGNSQLAKRRGYTVSRVFSPTGRFRWQFIEPTQDSFSYGDATADLVFQEIEGFCTMYQVRATWADRHYLTLTNVTGSFQLGEIASTPALAGGTLTWVGTSANITGNALQLSGVTGTLATTHVITGGTSGASGTITFVSGTFDGRQSPSIPDYTNYVANLIKHYTNKFIAYEVMNEPDRDNTVPKPTGARYNFYAEVLHQSMIAAKAVYPEVKIVGFSGISDPADWTALWNLCPPYVRTNLAATSVHLYEGNSFRNEEFVNLSRAAGGPPIWMTEGGCFNFSQYYGCRAAWRNNGIPLLSFRDSEDAMRVWNEALEIGPWNQIEALGGGCERHFYYGYQYYHHYGDPQSYSVQYTGLDLQEAAKPIDAAQSFTLYSIDGGKGYQKPARTDTGVKAYLIEGPWNTPYLMLKSVTSTNPPSRTNRIMVWGLTNGVQVQMYSVMGNELPEYVSPSTGITYKDIVPFDMIPTIIKGINGTTLNTISNAYMMGGFSSGPPDIRPPNITICDYPKGPVGPLRNHRIRIRWLAYDEFYTTRLHFAAVDTRYKVDNGVFSPWGQESFTEYPQEATFVRTVPNPNLASGVHTFTVEARDVAGNTSTNSITVTIL